MMGPGVEGSCRELPGPSVIRRSEAVEREGCVVKGIHAKL